MRGLLRPQAAKRPYKFDNLHVNRAHPQAEGLIRSFAWTGRGGSAVGGGMLTYELCLDQLISGGGDIRDDLPGPVVRSAGSLVVASCLDAPDLTPATGTGNGGLSIVAGVQLETASIANQICDKYQAGGLEYAFGVFGTDGRLYAIIYDNTAAAYIGCSAPCPSAGVYHDLVMTWDGATTHPNHVQIWADAVRIDNTDFSSGAFVQVRDTATNFTVAGSNPGFGVTNAVRFDYLHLLRRGLSPGDITEFADNPYMVWTLPGVKQVGLGAPVPVNSRFFFFYGGH